MPRPVRIDPAAGQESVWDYPRPPRLEPTAKHLRVVFGGAVVAETRAGYRVLETSHPPVYYFPPESIAPGVLVAAAGGSFCEWKGRAVYFSLRAGGQVAERVAWAYPAPTPAFAAIKDYVAFYAGPLDEATVAGERVTPQPGGFYGGWVTGDVVGPFKGEPGTAGW